MRLQKCFIAAAVILAGALGQAQQTFRVATYNVENFILEPIQNRPLKKPFAQAKIVESILAAKPDVIALQEMGKKTALIKLQAALKAKGLDLQHVEHLSAFDPAIHVAYLSRFPFKKITRHDNESFLLNGRRLHVGRGFAEVEIALERRRGGSGAVPRAHRSPRAKAPAAKAGQTNGTTGVRPGRTARGGSSLRGLGAGTPGSLRMATLCLRPGSWGRGGRRMPWRRLGGLGLLRVDLAVGLLARGRCLSAGAQ